MRPYARYPTRKGGDTKTKVSFYRILDKASGEEKVLDKKVLDMLLENIMGEAEGTASGVYSFLSNKAVQQVGTGDGSLVGTMLSVVIKSGFGTNADLSFKDCVVQLYL